MLDVRDDEVPTQLCNVMVREVCEGVEGTGVRCGVIGEVGVSHPMTDFEKRSLQAAAKAQKITGKYSGASHPWDRRKCPN